MLHYVIYQADIFEEENMLGRLLRKGNGWRNHQGNYSYEKLDCEAWYALFKNCDMYFDKLTAGMKAKLICEYISRSFLLEK